MSTGSKPEPRAVTVTVNGDPVVALVEPRTLLVDFLREKAQLTGTHTGCHQGWCGACTVLLDGCSTRSCLTFAVQADQSCVTTVEGIEDADGELTGLQRAFIEHSGFQCGFCTPGFVVLGTEILAEAADGAEFTRAGLQRRMSANICRCTGYRGILDALEHALAEQAAEQAAEGNEPAHSPSGGCQEGSEHAHSTSGGCQEGSEPAHSTSGGCQEGSEHAHSPSGPAGAQAEVVR